MRRERVLVAALLWCLSGSANAQQLETPLPCQEPALTPLDAYGAYTTGCSFATGADDDEFVLHGDPGTLVRIVVAGTSGGVVPILNVLDQGSVPVALIDPATGNTLVAPVAFPVPGAVVFEPLQQGDYILRLAESGEDNAGGYEISVQCAAGTCDSDGIPPPDPFPPVLAYDVPTSDALDVGVDEDRWMFHAGVGTLIRLNLKGGADLDPRLEVFDPTGQVVTLAPSTCNSSFPNYCSFQTDLAPTASGTYILAVSDVGVDTAASYQLSINCLAGACDSDLDGFVDPEPGGVAYGTWNPASPPATNPEDPVGITPAVDMDSFSVSGVTGTTIRIGVQGLSADFDPRIDLIRPDGASEPLGQFFCSAGSPSTCSFTTDVILSLSGAYRLFFSDEGTDNPGSYSFSVTCLVGACSTTLPTLPATCVGGVGGGGCRDNCRLQSDPTQADVGAVGPGSLPDGIGDLCQCGDTNGNGIVTGSDGTAVKRASLGLSPFPGGVGQLPAPGKCDVNGGTGGGAQYHCNGQDGTGIQRASLGLAPRVKQFCPAADAN